MEYHNHRILNPDPHDSFPAVSDGNSFIEFHPTLSDLRVLSRWRDTILQIRCQQHNHSTPRTHVGSQQSQTISRLLGTPYRERAKDHNERCKDRSHRHRWETSRRSKGHAQRNRSLLEREDRRDVELQVRGRRE
jgi:hypothetical protein